MSKADTLQKNLVTFEQVEGDDFGVFNNNRARLKYMKENYGKKMSISDSFKTFYGLKEISEFANVDIIEMELGHTYTGTVKTFDKSGIYFDIPGVKEEIWCKEDLYSSYEYVQSYLLSHDNQLMFEVREKQPGRFIVSVLNAYYNLWHQNIEKIIATKSTGIEVVIDSLVRGGYLAHTTINELCNLTGKTYTNLVFIPGSQIVLNIERDFERWIGQKVYILPQNFVKFEMYGRPSEHSLVGSRKAVLQILGMNNMAELYNQYEIAKKLKQEYTSDIMDGTVTGIINSNKTTGIFVELDDKYITGLAAISSLQLVNYKPGDKVQVRIKDFEVQDGCDPFYYKGKKIVRCNVRPVFELVV